MAFPADPSGLEVGIGFGADLSADQTTLSYTTISGTAANVRPEVLISRGRIGDSTITQPMTVDLSVNDPGGIYSPRNIAGPHYGQLRRNTPLRVRVDPGSGFVTRGFGYIPDWNPTWIGPSIGDRITLQATGGMTRIAQNRSDVRSALTRTIGGPSQPVPLAWWPCEDQEGSTTVASVVSTALPLRPSGIQTFPPSGGSYIPTFTGGISGAAGSLDLVGLAPLALASNVSLPSTAGFQLEFVALSDQGVDFSPISVMGFLTLTIAAANADGTPRHYAFRFTQSGPDISLDSYKDGVFSSTTTLSGRTITSPLQVAVPWTVGSVDNVLLTQVVVYDFAHMTLPGTRAPAATGFVGESASTRFARICAEEGIVADVAAGSTELMGSQLPDTTFNLLRECESSDEATMLDRATGKLGFDPTATRYNQAADLTVDYSQQVADLSLFDDDRDLTNDVTVTRVGGTSARYQLASGPLSVDPVTGSDDYALLATRSLGTDDQAVHHAHWLVMKGTVDEPRYVLHLNLRQQPGLISQWLACDMGARIVVNNPPAIHTGPAPLDLILEGYQELLDAVRWEVTLYCLPYRPYEVYQTANGTGNRSRVPAGNGETTVNVQRAATDTSFAVTSTTVRWIDSAAFAAQFPIPVIVAGEVMSCTAIAGTGLGQTMTMVRGVHGVAKTIPAGSAVQVWRAPVTAL